MLVTFGSSYHVYGVEMPARRVQSSFIRSYDQGHNRDDWSIQSSIGRALLGNKSVSSPVIEPLFQRDIPACPNRFWRYTMFD